jgi:hypothetical protein
MRHFGTAGCLILILGTASVRAESDFKIEPLKEAPKGLSAEIAKRIPAEGFRVAGKNGIVCDLWFAEDVPVKAGFKPTGVVNYPFQSGELVGAIRFPEKAEAGDFRGQTVPPGTYTLRYGQQPNDGNHLGTSDVRDFLLVCSPREDTDPKRIETTTALFKLSAKSVNTTHPAIFQMPPPPEQPHTAPAVAFNDEKQMLTVQVNVDGKADNKGTKVPLNLVTIGKSEG